MRSTSIRGALAAAALLCASLAHAGTFMPEGLVTFGSGGKVASSAGGSRQSVLFGVAFGYRFDSGFGVRAMSFADGDPWRGLEPTDRSFNSFDGIEATAYVPLATKLNLMVGAGIGQTSLNKGPNPGHEEVTDGVVSAGLQWHFVRNFAMELHGDYLTKTGVSSVGLAFQVPF